MSSNNSFKIFRSFMNMLKNVTMFTTASTATTLVTFEYIASFVVCHGPSMEPTLHTKDVLLTEQISPRMHWIEKGDIVVAQSPGKNNRSVCKRVVATAGDDVVYKERLVQVPKGHVWLEGDNKTNSCDSRDFGPVPMDLVRRRCVCKLWPSIDTVDSSSGYYLAASKSKSRIAPRIDNSWDPFLNLEQRDQQLEQCLDCQNIIEEFEEVHMSKQG